MLRRAIIWPSQKFTKRSIRHPYSTYAESIRSFYFDERGKLWAGITNGMMIIDPVTNAAALSCSLFPTPQLAFCTGHTPLLLLPPRYADPRNRSRRTPLQAIHACDLAPICIGRQQQTESNIYNDVIKFSNDELWFASVDKDLLMINVRTKNTVI